MAVRLLLGGLLLLVLVAGAELFLRQGGLSAPARDLIVERADAVLGGHLEIDRVRLSLFPPSVTATGVTVPPTGDAFTGGTVERVRLSLSPWSLLTGGLKSLDVRARRPDLGFRLPAPATGAPAVPLPAALPDWAAYGAHRVRVMDGKLRVVSARGEVTVTGIELAGAPDVTLRRYDLTVGAGEAALNGTPLLNFARVDVALEGDRVRVRKAVFEGAAGRLEATGEVRPPEAGEGEGPYLALRTTFTGEAEAAADLAVRLGAPPLTPLGHVAAEGRLYGTPGRLAWDGELTGTGLGLGDDPRRVDTLEARLRVGEGRAELVHVKAGAGGGELRGVGDVALAPPHAYEGRVRADDMALAWLLGRDLPLGRVSGEAHLQGDRDGPPRGMVQWRYRNPAVEAPPDDAGTPLWERLGVRLAEGHGTVRLDGDGTQGHDLDVATPGTRLTARVTRAADGVLTGEGKLEADDASEVMGLFGLGYVHGRAVVDGRLGGTLAAWRVEARTQLEGGRVRELKVDRMAGHVVLEPHRIAFDHVGAGGDGTLRLDGEVWLPPPGHGAEALGASLAASIYRVPLWQLVTLAHPQERLALDLPVSGKLHLVKGPGGLFTWSRVRAVAGTVYDQPLAAAEADLWVAPDRLTLSDVRLYLPGAAPTDGEPEAVAAGALGAGAGVGPLVRADGVLDFDPAAYHVTGRTDGLPLDRVQALAGPVPFLTGTFDGTAELDGDFEDPRLHLGGTLREVGFHGLAVGQGDVDVTLRHWLLKVRGDLKAPAGRDGHARFTLVTHLGGDAPFAVSARAERTDAVPWVRGLMPGFDELAREQLGDDYGLSAAGSVAAAGTFAGGPVYVLVKTSGAVLTAGGREARAVGDGRVTLRDGTVSVTGVRLRAEGLDLEAGGSLRPDERFDLKVRGGVDAGWLNVVRPEDGYAGGAARLDVDVAGPWDAPRVRGTVYPDDLVVTPPQLAAAQTAFTVNGEIRVDGPLEAPAAGDVVADLAPFSVAVWGNRLTAQKVHMVANAGVYRLPGVELTGDIGQARVDGGWEYDRRVDLKAVGMVELATLVRQVPGVSQASGRAQVSADLTGPWDTPRVRGGATLEGGRVRLDALQQILDVDTASVLYTDGKLVIDALDGRLGGGPVSAEGSYDLAGGEVRMAVTLDGYPFRGVPGLSGLVDGELLLSGKLPSPALSGDLHVRQALFDRRMQWGAWLVDSVTASRADVARSNPLADVRLAVRIYGDEDIVVDNNLAKLVLDLDLAVGGTVQEPGLLGRLDVRQGEVYFREHTFTVVSASVDFVQPGRVEPFLDVVARTTVDHALPDDPLRTETIDVDLTLTGPPDRLDLTLTSRPDMPQADLLSLLAVGRTTEELAGAGSGLGASEATYLATGPLQSQLEEQVHRFTGLDQFQLEPFYSESTTSSSARLTVGKKLFDGKGLVVYSAALDAAQQPVIQLTYRLGNRTSVLMEQDEEGRASGELRFRIRFR